MLLPSSTLSSETLDLGRPDVVAHILAIGVALGQFAAHVPEFLQIDRRCALGRLDPEGGEAARAAGARLMVFALHRLGQGEEGLGVVQRRIDHRPVQPVVGDDGEAVSLEGGPEPVGEGLEVGIVKRHRNRFDGAGGGGGARAVTHGGTSKARSGVCHTPCGPILAKQGRRRSARMNPLPSVVHPGYRWEP
jgi:hypothetical protein